MHMKKEHLGFLRISPNVTTKKSTSLRLGYVVFPYTMVAMQWHSVTQSAA